MFAFSSLDFAIREQTRDGKHRQESLASACKKQAFGWLGVCHFVASACSDPQVSVGSGRVWWVRFFVFARQEWIERMDDEEGEEDEESAQLRIWNSQTHSLSLTLFAWQDELFHTGEECIDRVAEARVIISWLHFFVIGHFCWTFATMTKLVKFSNVRIWKHHFRRKKNPGSEHGDHWPKPLQTHWSLLSAGATKMFDLYTKLLVFHTGMSKITPPHPLY